LISGLVLWGLRWGGGQGSCLGTPLQNTAGPLGLPPHAFRAAWGGLPRALSDGCTTTPGRAQSTRGGGEKPPHPRVLSTFAACPHVHFRQPGGVVAHSLRTPILPTEAVGGLPQTLKQACSQVTPRSAMCVQRFDDSLSSAIHITYRISLRSSSLQ